METGIKIRGELLVASDSQQRATFNTMGRVNRHLALIEVHANDNDDVVKIELIEERAGSNS